MARRQRRQVAIAFKSQTPESNDDDSNEEKVEALAEIICRAGDEAAAALFVLMGTIENSMYPKVLANAGKHVAFNAVLSRISMEWSTRKFH